MDTIEEIQKEVKDHFDIDMSEEEIEAIIASQSRATKYGIESLQDVQWIYFGKFKIKPGRKGALEKNKEMQKILTRPKEKGIKKIDFGIKIDIEPVIKIEE